MNSVGRRHTFWKRGLTVALMACLLFLAAFAFITRGTKRGGRARPNVILISIDTLRADHISGYGCDRRTTPFIDTLIRRGTSFSNAISPSPWTLPAHMSLFTSLYPHTHGVTDNVLALNDNVVTLPMLLKRAGYRTGGFASCLYLFPGYGFDRGFDVYIQRNTFPAPAV